MLYGGGAGNQNDMYKTAVIDTIVAEIQSVPGEDRCVLLLGYKAQIEEMFQVSADTLSFSDGRETDYATTLVEECQPRPIPTLRYR